MSLQPVAIGFCLSGLCPSLLPLRPLPITSAVHVPNVLFAAAKFSCSTEHDVQVLRKIPNRLICVFEFRATGNCLTAFQPTNCHTDSFSQTAQGMYIRKVTCAAAPPRCTSKLALHSFSLTQEQTFALVSSPDVTVCAAVLGSSLG